MTGMQKVWVELRALAGPIISYLFACTLGLVTFSLVGLYFNGGRWDLEDYLILGSIWAALLLGAMFGQVLAVARVRSEIIVPVTTIAFFGAVWFMATYATSFERAFGEIVIVGFFFLLLFPIGLACGLWSLRTRRGLFASWAPMMMFTGAVITWTEKTGQVGRWHEGAKYAIWSGATLSFLGLGIVTVLVYLLLGERHRLHRWRTAPVATELVLHRRDPVRPLSGCGSWFALGVLVTFLLVATSLISPYLWRTGKGNRDGGGGGTVEEPYDSSPPPDLNLPKIPSVSEQLKRAAKGAAQLGCFALTLIVLAVLGFIVFGRPVRRAFVLAHLRDPYWPVSPSQQALLHWRLAEVALGDAGVHRQHGETALEVSKRGIDTLPDLNMDGLAVAAAIIDRVAYGYTLEPNDTENIRRAAEMAYIGIWESLTEFERIAANYRGI